MDLKLHGKRCLVTGASAGIGTGIARVMAREGVRLAILARRADRLEALADEIAAETGAKVGGALYSDGLSPPDGPAGTYIDMVQYNIRELQAALSP